METAANRAVGKSSGFWLDLVMTKGTLTSNGFQKRRLEETGSRAKETKFKENRRLSDWLQYHHASKKKQSRLGRNEK